MYRLVFILLVTISSCATASDADRILISAKRNYAIPKNAEAVSIAVEWKSLVTKFPALKNLSFRVTDQHFGKVVSTQVIDINGDKVIDYLLLNHTLGSNEPVFAFLLELNDDKQQVVEPQNFALSNRFEINVMVPLAVYEKKSGKVKGVAEKLVTSTMNKYPDLTKFPVYAPNRWNYEYSFFMAGSFKLGKKMNKPEFVSYSKNWIDGFITEEGSFKSYVYTMKEYKLDDILPGRVVINLQQETSLPKYKSIADTLLLQLSKQPKTKDGGYWHKEVYPSQMWLDGIFMADVFTMQYAKAYNKPELFNEAVHQIKLIYKHTVDPTTGLLYHGWDESKNPVWAHPQKGTSPEFWGRAVGWFAMALVECLEYLPADHPERKDIIEILQQVSKSVLSYQDKKTSLWYQVLDKGNQSGNWIESSCSAMFAYAFAKAHHQGFLDETYLKASQKAYDAILDRYIYVDEQGNLNLDQTVKIGTLNPKGSKGDYQYYITTERRLNDYKGLAALLYASIELDR
jgi:unsaturated rhamnogalacturonyl hydrolase